MTVDPGQNSSAGVENLGGAARVDEVLTVRAIDDPGLTSVPIPDLAATPDLQVVVQHGWHRQQTLQARENAALELPADRGVGPGVALDDDHPVARRVVRVPVRHPVSR